MDAEAGTEAVLFGRAELPKDLRVRECAENEQEIENEQRRRQAVIEAADDRATTSCGFFTRGSIIRNFRV